MLPLVLYRQLLVFVLVRAFAQHAGFDDLAAQAQLIHHFQPLRDAAEHAIAVVEVVCRGGAQAEIEL